MGNVNTICVSVVFTIPGLNVPKRINVFRYLACHQFIAHSLAGRIDLRTSSQFKIFRQLYTSNSGPYQTVKSNGIGSQTRKQK